VRRSILVLLVIVVAAACDPVAQSTTTTDPLLPPPDGPGSTSSTTPVSTTGFVRAEQRDYRGVLPDGVGYTVVVLGGEAQELQEITGDFVAEVGGSQLRAAEVSYRNDGGQGTEYAEGHYLVTAGGWSIFVDFYPEVIEALGEDAESIITSSIRPTVKSAFPVLRLADPFSWDYEEYPVEARYQTFVVRRFCDDLAIACNDIGSVQLIAAERLYPGVEPLGAVAVSITSFEPGLHAGFLPDGTRFLVRTDVDLPDVPAAIDAGIVMEVDGGRQAVGIAQFTPGSTELGYSFENGVYLIPAGGGVQIEFYEHILYELGPGAESVIRSSILGSTREGFPILDLAPPFEWATDDDLPLFMQVQYGAFMVRRGCGEMAVACSAEADIQVIPTDSNHFPIDIWDEIEVIVEPSTP